MYLGVIWGMGRQGGGTPFASEYGRGEKQKAGGNFYYSWIKVVLEGTTCGHFLVSFAGKQQI